MSKIAIALIGMVYAGIAFEQYLKGNTAVAITFFGYAIGNVGLYMVAT